MNGWRRDIPDEDCECICNHSGACTGCGICWLEAYYAHTEATIRALFRLPDWPGQQT